MRKRNSRFECHIKAKVQLDNVIIVGARILNISLEGAFFELADYCVFQKGDHWQLLFTLPNSDMSLKFRSEVIHSQKRLVGVRFVQMDDDTMDQLTHLISLLTSKPDQVKDETGLKLDRSTEHLGQDLGHLLGQVRLRDDAAETE